jgi:hypothetical protein
VIFDSEGSLRFWKDVRQVIVPTLIDKVGYVPIPRIDYTDDSLDLVVEHVIMQGRNLLSNIVQIEASVDQARPILRFLCTYYVTGLPSLLVSYFSDIHPNKI